MSHTGTKEPHVILLSISLQSNRGKHPINNDNMHTLLPLVVLTDIFRSLREDFIQMVVIHFKEKAAEQYMTSASSLFCKMFRTILFN